MAEHIQITIRRVRGYDQMESREERIDLPADAEPWMLREAFATMISDLPSLRELGDEAIRLVTAQVERVEAENKAADAAEDLQRDATTAHRDAQAEDAARDAADEAAREPSESRA